MDSSKMDSSMDEIDTGEAKVACHAFLEAMYGSEMYGRWCDLKRRMNFSQESQCMRWVLDIVEMQLNGVLSATETSALENDDFDYSCETETSGEELASFADRIGSTADDSSEMGLDYTIDGINADGFPTDNNGVLNLNVNTTAVPACNSSVPPTAPEPPRPVISTGKRGRPRTRTVSIRNNSIPFGCEPGLGILEMDGDVLESGKSRSIPCTYCPERFCRSSELLAHMKFVHQKERHMCPMCNQTFTQHGSLKVHIKTVHQRIKDYVCPYCGRTFAQSSTMKRHVRTLHKPFDADSRPSENALALASSDVSDKSCELDIDRKFADVSYNSIGEQLVSDASSHVSGILFDSMINENLQNHRPGNMT